MKRIRVILLFLVLGAVMNVAVAWGIAATYLRIWDLVSQNRLRASAFGDSWQFTRTELNGVILLNGVPSGRLLVGSGYEKEAAPEQIPSWSRMAKPPLPREGFNPEKFVPEHIWQVIYISEVATGWPLISMYCRHEMEYPSQKMATKYGIVIAMKLNHPVRYTSLPLRILWSGFLLNSTLYATVLWIIWWSSGQLRRIYRLERGLCVKCKYDLRGTEHEACPECGTSILLPRP